MNTTKRIVRVFFIIAALFLSLSLNTSATETGYGSATTSIADNVVGTDANYEKGKTYTINGVDYFVEENGCVTVTGPAVRGVTERVEILPSLGNFTVTAIGYGAFYNCNTVKEVIIPETVTTIMNLAFEYSGLTDIEIKGKNVNVSTRFRGTPIYKDGTDNWIHEEDDLLNDVLIVSGYAVVAFVQKELVLGEEITGIAEKCFRYGCNGLTKLTVLNPDCHIIDEKELFPSHTVLCGYNGSSVQEYAKRYGYRFLTICNCEDTVFVPATSSFCNGTVGFGEGYWCDRCNSYASGGVVDTTFEHTDLDGDTVCDWCKQGVDTAILNAGKCGNAAVWTLRDDGVLRISGTGDVYTYYCNAAYREPWYAHKDEIRTFIAEDGIVALNGISFRDYRNLETVVIADTVLSLPKSFENCTALKEVNIPRAIRVIPQDCFKSCTSLERIFIPKNVDQIGSYAFYKCSSLREIDFETGYVKLNSDVFNDTAAYNDPENIKDGFLYIDNCLIAEISAGATAIVLGQEITSIATGWHDSSSEVTDVTVYNPDCIFPNDSGAVPPDAKLKGYVGSTAWFYAASFGLKSRFESLAPHSHTEVIDIPAVPPTSTAPGFTHRSHCAVCGEVVTNRQLVEYEEYEISIDKDVIIAQKSSAATSEEDGADIVITFAVLHDICTSRISQTVIYKVGEVKLSGTEFTYNGKVQKPDVTVKNSKGAFLVKDRDYRVTYSADSKYCGTYSVRVDYIGNYAGSKMLTYNIVIDAIVPVVTVLSEERIVLSWEKGHSDLVYRVYSVTDNENLSRLIDTRNNSYEVASPDPDTEYRFLVRAYVTDEKGNVYWGEKGETVLCTTESDKTINSIFDVLKAFIERFKYILQILLAME